MFDLFLDNDYEPGYEKTESEFNPDISNIIKSTRKKDSSCGNKINKLQDDGLWSCYKTRLKQYYKKLEQDMLIEQEMKNADDGSDEEVVTEEVLKGGLKVPIKTWNKLYEYAKNSFDNPVKIIITR